MDEKKIEIEEIREGTTLICKLSGWLDPNTSPEFVARVDVEGVKSLVFDLQNVEYVFSAGIRAFLIFQRKMEAQGGTMKLINVSDFIRSIFDYAGLAAFIE